MAGRERKSNFNFGKENFVAIWRTSSSSTRSGCSSISRVGQPCGSKEAGRAERRAAYRSKQEMRVVVERNEN